MKEQGRRSSRLHLEFEPGAGVCACGCGLTRRELVVRNNEIRRLHSGEPAAYGIAYWVKKTRNVMMERQIEQARLVHSLKGLDFDVDAYRKKVASYLEIEL